MLERLIETWLDNSSERSYQSPFCQMLVGRGYTILHNTRHTPIEFGKDVIARSPEGELCAYQLKGNPGSRVTLVQFREIYGQLQELVTLPVNLPGVANQRHRSFLVTNGQVDEDVHVAIRLMNEGFVNQGRPDQRLELIVRGDLLAWATELGEALWPSELTDINSVLEMMIYDGTKPLPLEKFHLLLSQHLRLGEGAQAFASEAAFRRQLTSTAIVLAISTRKFTAEQNHWAIASAWTMYCAYVFASCQKWEYEAKSTVDQTVGIALDLIYVSLGNLCEEIAQRPNLIEGNSLVDSFVYRQRYTLLVSLMSLYWFWCQDTGWANDQHKDLVEHFLPVDFSMHDLWGEGGNSSVPDISLVPE